MSLPSLVLRLIKVFCGMFSSKRLFMAMSIAAAFDEPPARPAPVGIFFMMRAIMGSSWPTCFSRS